MNIKRIIREEMDDFDWIKDEELPILPYIGKRFKLIRDDGQDSGRRYQILEYYFEDEYNKDFYIKSIILNPETLKPRTETPTRHKDLFHTPLSRAMELINNGNWVFLDTINESQDEFDWVRDVEAIKSPKVSEGKDYVIWLGELEESEREQIKEWLFKNLPKCKKPPFINMDFTNKAVITFGRNCGVGGYDDSSYELAKEAYKTWSKHMIVLDPSKILRGISQDEFDWVRDVEVSTIDLITNVLEGTNFYTEIIDDDVLEINWGGDEMTLEGTYVDYYIEDIESGKISYSDILGEIRNTCENCSTCPKGVRENYCKLYQILKKYGTNNINESQDEFDWIDNPDVPLRPYPGEEYIWIGWGKNSHTGASKRSIRFGTKLSDVIRIRHVDEPPLTGVYFESVDDKYNRDTTNIKTWNRLVRNGKIIPLKGMGINEPQDDFDWIKDVTKNITHGTCLKSDKGVEYIVQDINHKLEDVYVKSKRGGSRQTWSLRSLNIKLKNGTLKLCDMNESQDDFDWVRDSDPIEVIDLNDQWHVDTIESGDKLEITGEYDGIEFHNEPCEVVCVATCSKKVRNAWKHQILVSFEREFYSEETDETTHCGPDSRSEEKCNCGVYAMDRYGDPLMKGTCWWIHVPSLDEVVRINVGGITESEKILESLFNKLSILTEDGKTEPDMEWDFTKGELDKSKRWVKTKEDVKKYLTLLFDKMKRIPKRVKLNILKYVLASFIGIITFTELQQMVDEVSPEKIELNFTKKEKPEMVKKPETIKKPEAVKNVNVRKPSSKLYKFLRDEEGLETTAYDIGDGMVTIGYGHAERKGETDMVAGKTKISKEKAEELLKQDVETQTRYLNRILRQWEEKGIKPEITQGMYNSMISLMFNMGYGNFREADFVQDIKKGDFKTAKEKIKKTHITYSVHKSRREKESEMFDLP